MWLCLAGQHSDITPAVSGRYRPMAAIKDSHTIRSVVDSSGCSYLPLSAWNEDIPPLPYTSLYVAFCAISRKWLTAWVTKFGSHDDDDLETPWTVVRSVALNLTRDAKWTHLYPLIDLALAGDFWPSTKNLKGANASGRGQFVGPASAAVTN